MFTDYDYLTSRKFKEKNLKKIRRHIKTLRQHWFYEPLPFDFDTHFPLLFFWYLITLFLLFVMSNVVIYLCLCWYLYSVFPLLLVHSCILPDLYFVSLSLFFASLLSFFCSNFDSLHVFFMYCLIFLRLCFTSQLWPTLLQLILFLFTFQSLFCRVNHIFFYIILIYIFSFTDMSWFTFFYKRLENKVYNFCFIFFQMIFSILTILKISLASYYQKYSLALIHKQ